MSCERQQEISRYVDNELDPASQQEFSTHVRTCPECSKAILEDVALKQVVRSAGRRFQAPPELRLAVANKLRPRRRLILAWGWVSAAACLATAVLIVVFLYPQKRQQESTLAELVDQHVAALASQNPV